MIALDGFRIDAIINLMDVRSKQKGKKMSKKNYTFTDEQKAEFVARYNDFVSADKLAKEVGCSTPTMLRHLRSWGVTVRGKGRIKATPVAVAPVETPEVPEVSETNVTDSTEVVEVSEPEESNDSPVSENSNGFFGRMFASFGR